jgi:hypothetical protein
MRVDISIDVNSAVAGEVTSEYLDECVLLALSCMSRGNPKGVGMHPGITIEWELTGDEDAFA